MTQIKIEVTKQEQTGETGIFLQFGEAAWWMPVDAAERLRNALDKTICEAAGKGVAL